MDRRSEEEVFAKFLVDVGRGLNRRARFGKSGISLTSADCFQRRNRPHGEFARLRRGDVAGYPMLATRPPRSPRARRRLAGRAAHALAPVPAVVFTDPEIAWVGLTETQAKEQGLEIKVSKFPWAASGRALTLDRADGVTKILADPGTGKLLGVAIAGPGAGDLVSEASLALAAGASVADLARAIHPHPTLAETLGEAAELHAGLCAHLYRPAQRC
jgi:dihydrolipoamide dehydrogenase